MRSLRKRLTFRAVNRKGCADYDPGLQRHHLLPRQLLRVRAFTPLFDAVSHERLHFDDFRTNGLLLPARSNACVRLGLPLHRGPHRRYNELVIERVGQIERGWAGAKAQDPDAALREALFRLSLLQATLRRQLVDPPGRRMQLHSRDPIGTGFDFTELDAMAEQMWAETATS